MKIAQILKKVKLSRKKKAEFKRMTERYASYLKDGQYHISFMKKNTVLKYGAYPKRNLKSLVHFFLFGSFRIRNPEPVAQCTMAISSPFENYKMFDAESLMVYTFYSEPYWKKVEGFYDIMLPYFHTEIIRIDRNSHALVENYITNAVEIEPMACAEFIFQECENYLSRNPSVEQTISAGFVRDTLRAAELNQDVRSMVNYIESRIRDFDTQYPVVLCHNDVSLDNILTTDNQQFSLIDYELCCENLFFFDALGLILNSAVLKKETKLFEAFMAGTFDKKLEEIFAIYGFAYSKFDKAHDIFLFLLFRVYIVFNNSPEHLDSYTERFWGFVKAYNL